MSPPLSQILPEVAILQGQIRQTVKSNAQLRHELSELGGRTDALYHSVGKLNVSVDALEQSVSKLHVSVDALVGAIVLLSLDVRARAASPVTSGDVAAESKDT